MTHDEEMERAPRASDDRAAQAPAPDAANDLLPCPFCGSRARMVQLAELPEDDPNWNGFFVECCNASCAATTNIHFGEADQAPREKWNRRPAPDAPADALIVTARDGGHARGCQGRQYSCSCGYDEKVEAEAIAFAARIAALELRQIESDRSWQAMCEQMKSRAEAAEAKLCLAKHQCAKAEAALTELRNWLDNNTTFTQSAGNENNIALASVSKRIWFHVTDDEESYPFTAVIDAAIASAKP